MQTLAPEYDWRFIKRAAGRLRATTIPARDKRGCLPPIVEVIAQSLRMIAHSESNTGLSQLGRAALYRDGLLLLFLAYNLLRLRNLSSLRIGCHLITKDQKLLLDIGAAETKTRQPIKQELSQRLSFAVRRYIDHYRPILLQARRRWHTFAQDELWISRDGSPCSPQTLRNIVKKHLVGPNGKPASPHLFRTNVDVVPVILGHRSRRLIRSPRRRGQAVRSAQ